METHASGLEGRFTIRLRAADEAVVDAAIESKRRLAASSLLRTRPPGEAVRLLPLVYSLCGTAQGVAGLEASENALGIEVADAQTGARRLSVLAEAAAENARRVLLDWPELLGLQPEIPALVELRRLLAECTGCLYPDRDGWRLGGGALRPDRARLADLLDRVQAIVTGALDGAKARPAFRELDDLPALERWLRAADTCPARCLEAVRVRGLAGLGAAEVHRLSAPDWDRIAGRIAAQDNGRFARAPDVDGRPGETGPVVRHWDHPLIADIRRVHGCGLLARLAARIMDVALAPLELEALAPRIEDAAPRAQGAGGGGRGHAAVETARGWLFHLAEIENGAIGRYEILAPTDWNFHPESALARGLLSLAAGNAGTLRDEAELCVAAVDPCTVYEIVVEEADRA